MYGAVSVNLKMHHLLFCQIAGVLCVFLSAAIPAPAGQSVKGSSTVADITMLLRGEADTELAPHGHGNVYAPEVHRDGTRWLMWYGGQGRDGHDRIHLAESADGTAWKKRGVVLDRGSANHVNDPSVVRVGGVWWMFYTVAETGEADEIAAATSKDGVTWTKRGVVLGRGPGNAWDSLKTGRPSVLHEGDVFKMWYDGQATDAAAASDKTASAVKRHGRAAGYAESSDGLTWKRHAQPLLEGAGTLQVTRAGNRYVMVHESGKGVLWAESSDGWTWIERGLLTGLSGGAEDRNGRVTPFLLVDPIGTQATLYFGAASQSTWDHNMIGSQRVAIPEELKP
jgi:sucrose-6-phosphate hydrolase SacC (GH32 family)